MKASSEFSAPSVINRFLLLLVPTPWRAAHNLKITRMPLCYSDDNLTKRSSCSRRVLQLLLRRSQRHDQKFTMWFIVLEPKMQMTSSLLLFL
jgi:hypothetical protein